MQIRFPVCACLLLAALFVVAPAGRAAAQGTAPVPPADLAYRDVDRLAALGLLDAVLLGQRPYSRRELARMAGVARDRLGQGAEPGDSTLAGATSAEARVIVDRLSVRFADDAPSRPFAGPRVFLLDGISLGATGTDAVRRGFSSTFSDKLAATIDPLATPRRLGPPAVQGQSIALELAQRVEATSWLAFHARERLEYRRPSESGDDRTQGDLLLAGMRLRLGNVALDIGREQLAWAATDAEGLFLAADAPALDQISLTGDHPFVLPGSLRLLGPIRATLVLADLGPSAVRSHSKLLAYTVSVQPRPSVELGATFMNHFGGEGGRASAFGDRLIDFVPFLDIFRSHNYTDTTRALDVESDKLLGVNGRLRLDRLAGLVLTTELLIDDFDVHRIPTLFGWDGSQSFSATLPSIARTPLSLRLSATHMGVRTYTHGQLSNGITTRGRLLGDELGPDAKAFGAGLTWNAAGVARLGIEARTTLYSNSKYRVSDDGTHFVLHRVGEVTNELRDRLLSSLEMQRTDGIALVARAGAERIRNADFGTRTRWSYVLDVALRFAR